MNQTPQDSQPSDAPSDLRQSIRVGIDWADREHAYHAILPDGTSKFGTFKQNRKVIDAWLAELRTLAQNCTIDICIETSTGGLIEVNCDHSK